MPKGERWSRHELLLVFRLYCRTPYGRLSAGNAEIVQLARLLGRTPGAVTMKACNFAGLDPAHLARGVTSLQNRSRADEELWAEFQANAEAVAAEAEAVAERLFAEGVPDNATAESGSERVERRQESDAGRSPVAGDSFLQRDPPWPPLSKGGSDVAAAPPVGGTEVERLVRVRRVQSFFRAAVMVSYRQRCAISGLAIPELLNASHIIPWSANIERRADPQNGIALNVLYDRAFDRGLIAFDETCRVVLSPMLRDETPSPFHAAALLAIEGRALDLPERFMPDPDALAWHRRQVFRA